eukprot:gnl/TRDRNA2_/TRDRNA2_157850_c0_seq2.p1 gnl/TRDRNA2_/TRDRNA2_157850_c0~~gnl/TRDRNA2_/TRDRNA2_157850_c0_seq2.p1  ORF type:complete len:336 (+),score=36.45 gnl/TRDRNA2_/TRDRNA2_157850_c0_seq2:44-1051(+)
MSMAWLFHLFRALAPTILCLERGSHGLRIGTNRETAKYAGKIPMNLIFVVADNWEDWINPGDRTQLIGPGSAVYEKLQPYFQKLIINMNNTIQRHTGSFPTHETAPSVHLFDTAACEKAIQKAGDVQLMDLYRNLSSFGKQKAKPKPTIHKMKISLYSLAEDEAASSPWPQIYRADICRIAALHEIGGYYFDTDMLTNMDVRDVVKPSTEFVSVDSEIRKSFFTSFIGATPHHPILKLNLQNMVAQFYSKPYLFGTTALWHAFQDWAAELHQVGPEKVANSTQILKEAKQAAEDTRYEQLPLRGPLGKSCELMVFDPPPKKIVFWSRIPRSKHCD